jgi:hypothetical protein
MDKFFRPTRNSASAPNKNSLIYDAYSLRDLKFNRAEIYGRNSMNVSTFFPAADRMRSNNLKCNFSI